MQFYSQLADLLEYPHENRDRSQGGRAFDVCERKAPVPIFGADFHDRLEILKRYISVEPQPPHSDLNAFIVATQDMSTTALQELYTHTFDLNPLCALEVGFHLFGENYKRGVFLANLRETESSWALGQDRQLPDFLPVLLRLLDRLEPGEVRHDLIVECLLPAIHKMVDALETAANPYGHVLRMIQKFLELDVSAALPGAQTLPAGRNLHV